MVFRMALPWKDPVSGMLHLRQRTPLDLVDQVRGASILLPIGKEVVRVKIGSAVQASLRTKDAREAKARHAIADAALRMYWDTTRSEGTQLTHKQAVALAGEIYKTATSFIENRPHLSQHAIAEARGRAELRDKIRALGLDPEQLEVLVVAVGQKLPNEVLVQTPDAPDKYPEAVAAVFGEAADAWLFQKHLILDLASRTMLIREIWRAYRLMMRRAEQLAGGDYRGDLNLDRFPEFTLKAAPITASATVLTFDKLFDRWCEKQAKIKSPATIDRYTPSIRSFTSFVNGKDISAITSEDVYRWAEKRRSEGVSPKTVNKNDVVAVSSVLHWATRPQGGSLLTYNVARNVALDVPSAGPRREKTFRPDEISRILRAANSASAQDGNTKLLAAKRWCPWLVAYTGARISECTSIRGEDIRKESDIWLVELLRTKGNKPRRVPLHEHLIELGFLDFVQVSGKGPLFYGPVQNGVKTHPADLRAEYLARWVRAAAGLDDLGISPNHGWRHTFKTRLLAESVPERISDAITGHSSAGVARAYETPTIEMMAKAIQKFPRYRI